MQQYNNLLVHAFDFPRRISYNNYIHSPVLNCLIPDHPGRRCLPWRDLGSVRHWHWRLAVPGRAQPREGELSCRHGRPCHRGSCSDEGWVSLVDLMRDGSPVLRIGKRTPEPWAMLWSVPSIGPLSDEPSPWRGIVSRMRWLLELEGRV
jgi:hypothetical protein